MAPSAFAAAGLKDSGLTENVVGYFTQTASPTPEEAGLIVRKAEFSNKSFRLFSETDEDKKT